MRREQAKTTHTYICKICEFLGTNYCKPKRWPMGFLQQSFPPLAQISSYPRKDFASLQNVSSAAFSCATAINIFLYQKCLCCYFTGW